MKRIISALVTLTLLLSLMSCASPQSGNNSDTNLQNQSSDTASSDKGNDSTDETAVGTQDKEPSKDSYVCKLDTGVSVTIGGDAADAISALGEYNEYAEAPSCIHEGFDKVYTYDGFSVTTSPDADGKDYVAEISILSDEVAFENGVTIGSTEEDVNAAFGTSFEEQFGVRKYDLGGATAVFAFEDGILTAITVACAD